MHDHRLHLNITGQCNLRCRHCYRGDDNHSREATLRQISDILMEFNAFNQSSLSTSKPNLTLGGGEPTCHSELAEIISIGIKLGFEPRLVTNATLIDEDLALQLRQSGLKYVQVSLEGASPETHERVRGKGNWRRMLKGVQHLRQHGMMVILSAVLIPGLNIQEAPAMVDLAGELGVAGLKLARPVEAGRMVSNQLGTKGQFWDTYLAVLKRMRQSNYRGILLLMDPMASLLKLLEKELLEALPNVLCDMCQCHLTQTVEIEAMTGDVYFCRIRTKLGNLGQQKLKEIWLQHPLLNRIRSRQPEGTCSECAGWKNCQGGCPAVDLLPPPCPRRM